MRVKHVNSDGCLNVVQVKRLAEELRVRGGVPHRLPDSYVQRLFDQLDKDGDGSITVEEFEGALSAIQSRQIARAKGMSRAVPPSSGSRAHGTSGNERAGAQRDPRQTNEEQGLSSSASQAPQMSPVTLQSRSVSRNSVSSPSSWTSHSTTDSASDSTSHSGQVTEIDTRMASAPRAVGAQMKPTGHPSHVPPPKSPATHVSIVSPRRPSSSRSADSRGMLPASSGAVRRSEAEPSPAAAPWPRTTSTPQPVASASTEPVFTLRQGPWAPQLRQHAWNALGPATEELSGPRRRDALVLPSQNSLCDLAHVVDRKSVV